MSLLLAFIAGAIFATVVILLARRGSGAPPPEFAELRQAVHELQVDHQRGTGELRGLVQAFVGQQEQLVRQTGQLSEALRRPGVRGQWGETTLRQVVEAAGLAEHFDFDTQAHVGGDDDRAGARPDLVVHLPGGGRVPVDAKVPLDAYLDAVAAEIPSAREHALDEHVRQVRAKVRDLAAKAYWSRFDRAPEMVVMFIASEAAFAAAVHRDPVLLTYAARQKVVIATPATMLALLQVVQLGWREHALSANAEKLRILATELINRLGTFVGHLAKVGKALEQAAKAHNQAVGSMETRVLATARKFDSLGVPADIPEPQLVATIPRLPADTTNAPPILTLPDDDGAGSEHAAIAAGNGAVVAGAGAESALVQDLWCPPGSTRGLAPSSRASFPRVAQTTPRELCSRAPLAMPSETPFTLSEMVNAAWGNCGGRPSEEAV